MTLNIPNLVSMTILTSPRHHRDTFTEFNPAVDVKCGPGICLTSFVWCSPRRIQGCFFPKDSLPLRPEENVPFAVLFRGGKYEISWKNADPGRPVLVEWLFVPGNFPWPVESRENLTLAWSLNVTRPEKSVEFQPDSILRSLRTPDSEETSVLETIVNIAGSSNRIRISQPGSGLHPMYSDEFSVQSDFAWTHAKNILEFHGREERKWMVDTGIGVGVGVGVPVLIAIFILLLRRQRKKNIALAESEWMPSTP